jgi:hypothetical protein
MGESPALAEAPGLNYEPSHHGSVTRTCELCARVQSLNFDHHGAAMACATAKKYDLGVGTVHRIKRDMTAAPDLLCSTWRHCMAFPSG